MDLGVGVDQSQHVHLGHPLPCHVDHGQRFPHVLDQSGVHQPAPVGLTVTGWVVPDLSG